MDDHLCIQPGTMVKYKCSNNKKPKEKKNKRQGILQFIVQSSKCNIQEVKLGKIILLRLKQSSTLDAKILLVLHGDYAKVLFFASHSALHQYDEVHS